MIITKQSRTNLILFQTLIQTYIIPQGQIAHRNETNNTVYTITAYNTHHSARTEYTQAKDEAKKRKERERKKAPEEKANLGPSSRYQRQTKISSLTERGRREFRVAASSPYRARRRKFRYSPDGRGELPPPPPPQPSGLHCRSDAARFRGQDTRV